MPILNQPLSGNPSSIPDVDAYVILNIDPGTDTLGFSVFRVDVRTGDIEVLDAGTYHADRRLEIDSTNYLDYSARMARIQEHRVIIRELLETHRPNAVGCETPFIGRFAQSGMALSELYSAIQSVVIDFSPMISFVGVDNRSAKMAVGAKVPTKGQKKLGKKMKDVVREAVLALIDIVPVGHVKLKDLDEHAIDTIAIGYFVVSLLRAEWLRMDKHVMGLPRR